MIAASVTAALALVGTGPVLRPSAPHPTLPLVMSASTPPPMSRRATVIGLAPLFFAATALPVQAVDSNVAATKPKPKGDPVRERKRLQEQNKRTAAAKTKKAAADRKKAKSEAKAAVKTAQAQRAKEAKDAEKKLQQKREADRKVRKQEIAKTAAKNKAYAVAQKKQGRTKSAVARKKKKGGGGLGFLGNLLALGTVGVGGLLALPSDEPVVAAAPAAAPADELA